MAEQAQAPPAEGVKEGGAPPPEPDWRENLDDELKTSETFKDFKNEDLVPVPKKVLKSHEALARLMGNRVKMPDENSTEEEVAEFHKKMGVPENVAGYELEEPELPEEMPRFKEPVDKFLAGAQKLGFTKAQVNFAMGEFYGLAKDQYLQDKEDRKVAMAKAETQNRKKFGKAYDRQVANATDFMVKVGGEEIWNYMEASKLGSDPMLIRLFAKAGERMAETQDLENLPPDELNLTPDSAAKEIKDIRENKENPFHKGYTIDSSGKAKEEANKRVEALYRIKNAGKEVV